MMEGLCKYESLLDGVLGLEDLAEMNEALDAKYANQRLIEEAMKDR